MKRQNLALAVTLGAIFFCITFFGWLAHDTFRIAWLEAILVGVAFSLITLLVAWPPAIKQQMLKALPDDLKPVPASPGDFPLLDLAKVEAFTGELRALGFTLLCDCSEQSASTQPALFFSRVMLHDEQHCFVTISQYFPAGKAWPVNLIFLSGFGAPPRRATFEGLPPLPVPGRAQKNNAPEENFWLYSTHNFARRTLMRVRRHRHLIGRRLGGAGPAELFQQHLADREKILARLELPLARDLTIEHYFAWNNWVHGVQRQQLQRTNFYFALPRAYFETRDEWWGELGQIEPLS